MMTREEAIDILFGVIQANSEEENEALDMAIEALEQTQWIPCSERLPKENVPVNITWVNRNPVSYYADIKDIPFTATGVYFEGKWYWWSSIVEDLLAKWYWWSSIVEDLLAEYGRTQWNRIVELMDESIEVIAWMPLPEPYRKENQ